jgi:hypothetical protein
MQPVKAKAKRFVRHIKNIPMEYWGWIVCNIGSRWLRIQLSMMIIFVIIPSEENGRSIYSIFRVYMRTKVIRLVTPRNHYATYNILCEDRNSMISACLQLLIVGFWLVS